MTICIIEHGQSKCIIEDDLKTPNLGHETHWAGPKNFSTLLQVLLDKLDDVSGMKLSWKMEDFPPIQEKLLFLSQIPSKGIIFLASFITYLYLMVRGKKSDIACYHSSHNLDFCKIGQLG